MDTACVELKYSDGIMVSIDTIAVENEIADNMVQRSELDWLIYSKPLEYAQLTWRKLADIPERQAGTQTCRLMAIVKLPSPGIDPVVGSRFRIKVILLRVIWLQTDTPVATKVYGCRAVFTAKATGTLSDRTKICALIHLTILCLHIEVFPHSGHFSLRLVKV